VTFGTWCTIVWIIGAAVVLITTVRRRRRASPTRTLVRAPPVVFSTKAVVLIQTEDWKAIVGDR
jgi:hypothetical protein